MQGDHQAFFLKNKIFKKLNIFSLFSSWTCMNHSYHHQQLGEMDAELA
jgi:hypothetical protein